jgi:hypothetical protein
MWTSVLKTSDEYDLGRAFARLFCGSGPKYRITFVEFANVLKYIINFEFLRKIMQNGTRHEKIHVTLWKTVAFFIQF